MADGLNLVMLVGNLGADPELRATNGGQSVLNLRLATSKSFLDRNKVRQERTEWHTVKIWGPRAEGLAKFLSKGHRLTVVGEIRYTSWEDDAGQKRYSTEIVARDVVLGGGGSNGGQRQGGREPEPPDDYPVDDDIPF